jgi:hypothetical protein
MTEGAEIIVEIIPTMIGNAPSVKIQTLHSEPNVTDVENLREGEVPANVEIGVVETTAEEEMTDVAEMIVAAETTDAVETTEVIILTTIGNVENVRTQTSPSELNVIVVEPLKAEGKHLPKNGKAMTEDLAIEEVNRPHAQEIGIVHNVVNPISLGEMIVSVVDAPRE